MLFNSYVFVFLFFPLCIFGFYICRFICRKKGIFWPLGLFLTGMSLWFYGFFDPANIPALLLSMAVNYGIYFLMTVSRENKKIFLFFGLFVNLGALILYKYTMKASFVPLGISFFTFSQIAFLMECYGENRKRVSILDYSVYISFFPKLTEGPIALPSEMMKQLYEVCEKKFSFEQFYRGICLFVMGLAKKALLADTFGRAVDFGYSNLTSLNSGDAVIVMLSYTLQLYFDFSGYCDMAMGVSNMLSYTLPLNFNSPYKAGNIIEFWKGWHITLTRFFTKYLYIPLGGSRRGKARTYLNILIIFLVSGIWHGAGWQFIIWGMLHGILYAATRWWLDRKRLFALKRNGIKRILSVAATFLFVNVAWVFFRAPSVKEALFLLKTIVRCQFAGINWNLAGYFNLDEFWYVIKVLHIDRWQYAHYILMAALLLSALLLVFFGKTAVNVAEKLKPSVVNTVIMAVLFVWCVLTFSQVSSFIYQNF